MYSISNPLDFLSLLTVSVFYGCKSLNTIVFESTKTKTILLSDYITELGENAFENCQSIEDVYIEMNVNNIPKNTFKNCYNLTNVYFKDNTNIVSINDSAFENCSKISKLELPTNLQSIGNNCFKHCSKLEQIIVYNNNNINIQSSSFDDSIQLSQPNTAVIFTNNNSVKNYFTSSFSNVKQLPIDSIIVFKKYFYEISELFNYDHVLTKNYLYPSFDIKLTTSNQIVTSEIVNSSISVDKQSQFRNLILKFIFEINKPYNSFVVNNQNLKLNITQIGLNSSYFITVYNSLSRNIDSINDIKSNNYLAIYGLLDRNYSEILLNNYKVRLSLGLDNKYNLEYSTNNFVSSTSLTNINSNNITNITNYNILTGDYNDYIIYKDIYSSSISLYIEGLQLSITSSLSEVLAGQSTNSMTADVYTTLDIPLSVIINTFMYWSDGINVDNIISDGVKFKTVNHSGWQNIYLARSITNSEFGGIPYYKPNSIMSKNEIKYDFVRYLALNIFKTSAGVDIFRNNDEVTSSIEQSAQIALLARLTELEGLGEFTNEDTINNISRIIFRQIAQQQPNRIVPNDGDWTPMNLYANDKIFVKLTIHPEPNQHKILNQTNTTSIPGRSYLIGLNLISG